MRVKRLKFWLKTELNTAVEAITKKYKGRSKIKEFSYVVVSQTLEAQLWIGNKLLFRLKSKMVEPEIDRVSWRNISAETELTAEILLFLVGLNHFLFTTVRFNSWFSKQYNLMFYSLPRRRWTQTLRGTIILSCAYIAENIYVYSSISSKSYSIALMLPSFFFTTHSPFLCNNMSLPSSSWPDQYIGSVSFLSLWIHNRYPSFINAADLLLITASQTLSQEHSQNSGTWKLCK